MDKEFEIYCDGSVSANGQKDNKGAWSAVLKYNGIEKHVSKGGYVSVTNNQMELMPLLECLPEICKRGARNIRIKTDSKYIVNGIQNRKNWIKRKDFPNKDMWLKVYDCIECYKPTIQASWVRGHDGQRENEMCDEAARSLLHV